MDKPTPSQPPPSLSAAAPGAAPSGDYVVTTRRPKGYHGHGLAFHTGVSTRFKVVETPQEEVPIEGEDFEVRQRKAGLRSERLHKHEATMVEIDRMQKDPNLVVIEASAGAVCARCAKVDAELVSVKAELAALKAGRK